MISIFHDVVFYFFLSNWQSIKWNLDDASWQIDYLSDLHLIDRYNSHTYTQSHRLANANNGKILALPISYNTICN